MIRRHRHDDVMQLAISTRRSRLAGFEVNAYLVRGVLVDCGFPAAAGDVKRLLRDERISGVIVTHAHEDHAGNIEAVARRGIPIAAHPETLALVRDPSRLKPYRRFTWGEPPPLVSPVVPFAPAPLEVIHTPGHSSDHCAVWDPATHSLFSADLFIGVKVRVAHHDERPRQLVASLRRVVALEPARVFDAHRGLLPAALPTLRAKIDWMEETIGEIERASNSGLPPSQVARAVLGRRDRNDYMSAGEYSRINFVRAVLAEGASDGRPPTASR